MEIKRSEVTKILISDIIDSHKLDPITVFLEDFGPGQGKVIMECYGKSWSAYWGGMGNNKIAQFICSCDEHYIAGKFSSMRSTVPDYDGLLNKAQREIAKLRKNRELKKDEARELFDDASRLDDSLESSEPQQKLMNDIFGGEWWHCIPEKSNHHYEYLCRIITTVQEVLRSRQQKIAA